MNNSRRKRFIEAVNEFNEGNFYKCHDILEDIWYEVRDDSRDFYQGIIHIAVGFHHLITKKNVTGAVSQFDKAVKKLTPYKPEFAGVEIEMLAVKVKRIVSALKKDNNYRPKTLPKIILR